eukprot:scaffold165166_cov15-Tisochrysis_lutea.AAC.1
MMMMMMMSAFLGVLPSTEPIPKPGFVNLSWGILLESTTTEAMFVQAENCRGQSYVQCSSIYRKSAMRWQCLEYSTVGLAGYQPLPSHPGSRPAHLCII